MSQTPYIDKVVRLSSKMPHGPDGKFVTPGTGGGSRRSRSEHPDTALNPDERKGDGTELMSRSELRKAARAPGSIQKSTASSRAQQKMAAEARIRAKASVADIGDHVTFPGTSSTGKQNGKVVGHYANGDLKVSRMGSTQRVKASKATRTHKAADIAARRSSGSKAAAKTRKIQGSDQKRRAAGEYVPAYYGANKGRGSYYD